MVFMFGLVSYFGCFGCLLVGMRYVLMFSFAFDYSATNSYNNCL